MNLRVVNVEELHALLSAATPAELVLFTTQPRLHPKLPQLLLNFVASHEFEFTGCLQILGVQMLPRA